MSDISPLTSYKLDSAAAETKQLQKINNVQLGVVTGVHCYKAEHDNK